MEWLNEWIAHWTPVLWITATWVLLLAGTWSIVIAAAGKSERQFSKCTGNAF